MILFNLKLKYLYIFFLNFLCLSKTANYDSRLNEIFLKKYWNNSIFARFLFSQSKSIKNESPHSSHILFNALVIISFHLYENICFTLIFTVELLQIIFMFGLKWLIMVQYHQPASITTNSEQFNKDILKIYFSNVSKLKFKKKKYM